jgi:hypothetical protein
MLIVENWKEIPGYEGWYAVSDLGRIKSLTRTIEQQSRTGKVYSRVMKEKILAPRLDAEKRYLYAHLCTPTKNGNVAIHRAVLLTFVGPAPKDKREGCHNDGNTANNRLSNLRWGSRQENEDDKREHGTLIRGMDHYCAKYSDELVERLRRDWAASHKGRGELARLARKHGVAPAYAGQLIRNERRTMPVAA